MKNDFQKGEIVIYTSEDGTVSLDTKLENETIWLTQKQMAELFRQVIEEPEFKGIFRQIVFAIIEDHNSKGINYEAFCEVFNKKQLL